MLDLTPDELQTLRQMTRAIWGIDVDAVDVMYYHTRRSRMAMPEPSPLGGLGRIEFEFDRWLVPWKVRGAYNADFRLLVLNQPDLCQEYRVTTYKKTANALEFTIRKV